MAQWIAHDCWPHLRWLDTWRSLMTCARKRLFDGCGPTFLIKGEDWRGKTLDGQEFVESYGGRVVLAPLLQGHSTTATIERMRAAEAADTRIPTTHSSSKTRRSASIRA